MRNIAVLPILLFLVALVDFAVAAVSCDEVPICQDSELSGLNAEIARREQSLAGAAMHPALRGEIGQSDEDWRDGLAECMAANDSEACYRVKLKQRLDVVALLDRLFAGPRLASDPADVCSAQRDEIAKCADETFTTADTVFGIMARALATSLATIDIQNTSSPDGGSVAERAEDAFRKWRSAECHMLELSPLVEKKLGGAVACEAGLTWQELMKLADLLGRAPHWSERIDELAAGIRACLDRGRDEDVELRVIDVFNDDAGDRVVRLLGSRGRYDCAATGDIVAEFSSVPAKNAHPGEGVAVFVPVQGLRAPQELLSTMPDRTADCYETSAVIQAGARLSGWIALSRCD